MLLFGSIWHMQINKHAIYICDPFLWVIACIEKEVNVIYIANMGSQRLIDPLKYYTRRRICRRVRLFTRPDSVLVIELLSTYKVNSSFSFFCLSYVFKCSYKCQLSFSFFFCVSGKKHQLLYSFLPIFHFFTLEINLHTLIVFLIPPSFYYDR